MIIVPQRGIDVNIKEEKIMKVKVRKRKPAPVAAEQAPKAIYIVKRELNGKFGVPHHVEFDDYTAPAPVAVKQTEKNKSKASGYAFLDNKREFFKTISDDSIEYLSHELYLTEIPLSMLDDLIASNTYVKDDGSRFILVPSAWIWYYLC